MDFSYQNRDIHTFAITPRTLSLEEYWKHIELVGKWCADFGLTGPLLFNGNDTFVEVFVAAQTMIEKHGLSPLIAVNPEYMHPFTAAKFVSSYAYAFEQKVYLNMITGTSLSQAKSMHCDLDHDQKYDRLTEYINIIQALTKKAGEIIHFEGDYYNVSDLKLPTPIPENLLPGYFIAGHSEAATKTRDVTGAIGMKMLSPDLENAVTSDRGIHFGIVCRESNEKAWEAANRNFPEDKRGQRLLKMSMSNTDSVWKKRLMFAEDTEDRCDSGYWLAPFRNFQADCPYFVGSQAEVRDLIVNLVKAGVDEFILDLCAGEEEFANCAMAFSAANEVLNGSTDTHA